MTIVAYQIRTHTHRETDRQTDRQRQTNRDRDRERRQCRKVLEDATFRSFFPSQLLLLIPSSGQTMTKNVGEGDFCRKNNIIFFAILHLLC